MPTHRERVSDIVLHQPEAAAILIRYGIDFCSQGHLSLEDACSLQGIPLQPVLCELESLASCAPPDRTQVGGLATPALVDAIVATHHDYVWARLPYLVPMAAKIARHCRPGGDGCADLAALVADLRSLMLDHLDREERILSALAREGDSRFVTERIAALHAEHLAVGDLFKRIRAVTLVDHHAGDDACAAERALHRELALLDDHVRSQILLEERLIGTGCTPAHS